MKKLFTPEELEELRRADAEIDESFRQTQEEIRQSQARDRQAKLAAMEPEKRKKAIRAAAYYQANPEKEKARRAAYREANREKYNAWQREYRARKRAASGEANSGSGKEKI